MEEYDKSIMPSIRLWGSRFAYCMFIFSFFLPFVAVQQCSTKEMAPYYGTDLISGDKGVIYLIPMILFFGYFISSFFKKRISVSLHAFLQSWKALSAVLSGVIVGYLPHFDYLLNKVYPQIGQILAFVACFLIYLNCMAESAISLVRFKKEPQRPNQAIRLSRVMYIIHFSMLLISCALIVLCFVKGSNDITGLFMLLLLFLSFLFSESIVLYSIKRNEKWTYVWSIILLLGIGVFLFIYIFSISDYIII